MYRTKILSFWPTRLSMDFFTFIFLPSPLEKVKGCGYKEKQAATVVWSPG
jgi:hypothetical protein